LINPAGYVVIGMSLPTMFQARHYRDLRAAIFTMLVLLLLRHSTHSCRLCGDWHVAASHVAGTAL
jgi:hypothetical protein